MIGLLFITKSNCLVQTFIRILEGEEITDPAAFTRRLQGFVEKSLAA